MQSTLEETDRHTVKISVEIPFDEVRRGLDRAYRRVGAEVSSLFLEAQKTTLASLRVLDHSGTVIGGRDEVGMSLAHVEEVSAWLSRTVPDPLPPTVVHGDFRLGNTMVDRNEPSRILAVLDWEMGAIGDPRADVGYLLATYSEPGGPPSPLSTSLVTTLVGFPSRAELVDRYVARSGRDVEPLAWFEGLALWKAAVFCEAIYGRYLRGELGAEDERAARFEQGVPYLAEAAAEAIAS